MQTVSIPIFIKTFEIPIYFIDVILVIHDDFELIDKKYKLNLREGFDGDDPNECHALTCIHPKYNEKSEIYVLFKPKWLDIDTLSHEITHIISNISVLKGIVLDPSNDEPLAYLTGYITKQLTANIVAYMDKYGMDVRKFLLPA